MLRLAQDFTPQRLELCAHQALELALYGYGALAELIKRPSTPPNEQARSQLRVHPNVRGADYFQLSMTLEGDLPC